MKKTLIQTGNSWQLYINKPIAKLIGINEQEYTVLITIQNKILTLQKINNTDLLQITGLVKKLTKRKSGYGLNFSIPIIELLDINPETDNLQIEVDGNKLKIKKAP